MSSCPNFNLQTVQSSVCNQHLQNSLHPLNQVRLTTIPLPHPKLESSDKTVKDVSTGEYTPWLRHMIIFKF